MKIITDSFKLSNPEYTASILNLLSGNIDKIILFDIETTGFSRKACTVYLVGAVYFVNGNPHYKQWFADSPTDEAAVISDFSDFLQDFNVLVHFNGDGFDIPFLIERAHILNVNFDLSHLNSLDLFKIAKQCKGLLNLDNYKQKTIEKFLNINREDKYSGGELIDIYKAYVAGASDRDKCLKLLLLHNHDDCIGMTDLLPIISYFSLVSGQFEINELYMQESNNLIINADLALPVISPLTITRDPFSIAIKDSSILFALPVVCTELKYFYEDYRNYFYIPDEDKVVHRGIGQFIDKSRRTKATKENCYTRYESTFIHKPSDYEAREFVQAYKSPVKWMELTDKFTTNPYAVKDYLVSIISEL